MYVFDHDLIGIQKYLYTSPCIYTCIRIRDFFLYMYTMINFIGESTYQAYHMFCEYTNTSGVYSHMYKTVSVSR